MTQTALMPPAIIPSRRAQMLDQRLRAVVYCAGSTALMNFAKSLGLTAFYVSVSGRRDYLKRIENRRQLSHGSILADPSNREATALQLPLGREHFLSPIDDEAKEGILLPDGIRIFDGIIEVDLDPKDTSTAFDKRLATALADRKLNTYLDTADGQTRLIEAGHDQRKRPCTADEFIGRRPRISLVTEAFLFRPRREMQALINVIHAVRRQN